MNGLFLFIMGLAVAVGSAAGGQAWNNRVWRADDGLLDNKVVGVQQSSDGFLWVATVRGVMRFDGVEPGKYMTVGTYTNCPAPDAKGLLVDLYTVIGYPKVRYVKINATRFGAPASDEAGVYRLQLKRVKIIATTLHDK